MNDQEKNEQDIESKVTQSSQGSKNYVSRIFSSMSSFVVSILWALKNYSIKCHLFLKNNRLTKKAIEKKKITFSLIGVLAVLMIWFLIHEHNKENIANPVSNLMKINRIQEELNSVQNSLATTSQMNDQERGALEDKLQKLDDRLNNVSNNVGTAQSDQIKNIQATLESDQFDLSQKVDVLNKEISRIKEKVFPAPTLNSKVLPFDVVSVDPWNGKPYAQLVQKNNSAMVAYVGLYQKTGGWKVIDINAPEQTVTFVNSGGQVVHVRVKQF